MYQLFINLKTTYLNYRTFFFYWRSGGTGGQGTSSSGNNHSQGGNSDSDSGSPSQSEVNRPTVRVLVITILDLVYFYQIVESSVSTSHHCELSDFTASGSFSTPACLASRSTVSFCHAQHLSLHCFPLSSHKAFRSLSSLIHHTRSNHHSLQVLDKRYWDLVHSFPYYCVPNTVIPHSGILVKTKVTTD